MSVRDWLVYPTFLRRVQSRKNLSNIIANTGWLMADRILRIGLGGMLVGIWVARYLGTEQFGNFTYAYAYAELFSPLATLGLHALVIREITHDPEKQEQILGTTFWLFFLGSIISLIFSVGTISILRHGDRVAFTLVAIFASAGIFRSFEIIELWFQSQVQSKYAALARNIAFLISITVKITLISIKAPLLSFALITAAETIFNAIGLIYFYKLRGYSLRLWRWSLPLAKMLLQESKPLILVGFTTIIYMKIDQIMLGQMVGAQAVGLYSAAVRVSEVWYFVPAAIASSVAPAIYALKREANESLYYQRIEELLRLLSFVAIIIAVPMTFASAKVITTLFGSEYIAAAPILAIHIWAALFVFMGVGESSWFIAEGLAKLTFQKTLIGAVINILLNFLLIPFLSGIGAAIATVIAQAFACFFANALNVKSRKMFWIQFRTLQPLNIKCK
jgi:PST family polysaccharide transporter